MMLNKNILNFKDWLINGAHSFCNIDLSYKYLKNLNTYEDYTIEEMSKLSQEGYIVFAFNLKNTEEGELFWDNVCLNWRETIMIFEIDNPRDNIIYGFWKK